MQLKSSARRGLPILIITGIVACAPPFVAAQVKGSSLQPAEGLENWKYKLDLGSYPTGKYNLVVEGKDKAGNVTTAAPMNIYVDPKSDLPLVSIINPFPLMRVGGDLNIVGTAVDDDGIDRVEVSLDGGEFQKAEGGEFWSLYLKTSEVPEGRRSLEVRAVDINGLAGPSAKVKFDLDRTKPLAAVDNPPVGTLVSGQVKIAGTVFDANGVRSLEISQDEGKTWAKVGLNKGKDPLRMNFSWPVDTKKMKDGPKVFKLRSADMVGSTSTAAYLVFIDNTKPAIEIARPAPGQAIHGIFSIAGAVRDAVGVKKLSYEFGSDDKGEIPLTKGDPFFVKQLDAGKVKGDKAVVTLIAEDTIGNVTRLDKAYAIDRKADKPVLTVLGPEAEASQPAASQAAAKGAAPALPILRPGEPVWGSIADDDGAAAFRWSLDGAAAVEVPSTETFSLALPAASSGKHALTLVPVDVNGLAGDAVAFPFIMDKGPGSVAFDRITSAKASRNFAQGAQSSVDAGESLEGSISAPNAVVAAEYSIAGGSPKPIAVDKDDKARSLRFKIPLDRSFPYGFAPVVVRVKDATGNAYEGRALLFITDYGVAREETGFRFVDPRLGEDGRVVFGRASGGDQKPFLGAFYGGELSAIRLDPPTALVEASYDGRVVTIKAVKDGTTVPTKVVGRTAKGHEFSAGPFAFVTDSTPPELAIGAPVEGAWFSGKLAIAGTAKDLGGKVSLSWRRLPDGASADVDLKADGSFSIGLSAADMPAGPFSVELEAKDEAGNVSRAYRSLGADDKPPAVKFLAPEAGSAVWGPEDVAASVDDASGIASVEYAADGKSFAAIEWKGRFFVHRADFAANPSAAYRVTDKAGNQAVARPDVKGGPAPALERASPAISVEPASGEPRIELAGTAGGLKASLVLPGLSETDYSALGEITAAPPGRFATRLLVQGPVSLKGQVALAADGQAKAVSASLDGGATYRVLASNKDAKSAKAVLPFALASDPVKLQPGPARWILKIEDFAGGTSFCPLYVLVDAKAPTIGLLYPEQGAASLPGPFPLALKVEDENGVAAGDISIGASKEALDFSAKGRYFVRMVDPSTGAKGSPVPIVVDAKDDAGNQAAVTQKYGYDAAGDNPKIKLDSLAAATGGLAAGSAADDDGAPAIKATIDAGEAISFPGGAFALALPALPAGKHTLTLEAGDAASGASTLKTDFVIKNPAPELGEYAIADPSAKNSTPTPWAPGIDAALSATSVLVGKVAGGNGALAVSASFNGGAPIAATLAKADPGSPSQGFTVAVPATIAYDRVSIELSVKDAGGLSSIDRLELHKVLPPAAGSDDVEGIRFFDPRIKEGDAASSLSLVPGDKVVGRFNGRPVKTLTIQPAAPSLSASFDGTSVAIEAVAEGLVGSSSLLLETVDGDKFAWGPFVASVDAAPPTLELSSPSDGDWTQGAVKVAGKAADANGILSVDASVNGGAPLRLFDAADPKAAGGPKGEALFDMALPLATAPDGSVRLDFLARDKAGRETRVLRFVNKDTLPPELAQVEPLAGETVNGLTTFVGEAKDGGRLASAAFIASPSAGPEEVAGIGAFSRDLDLARLDMPLPEGGGFVVADKAGNKATFAPSVVVDKEKDKPVVEIQSPSEMEVMRGDFVISGVAYDDDGLAAAYYRIDGGAWTRLDMQGTSFSVPVALKDTTDNEHLVEAKAEDIYGVQGDVASRKYRISKEEPVALMTAPPISKPVRGTVKLVGSAADANGIKDVSVSVDNRTSYDKPVGTTAWSLGLDTKTLSDGIHAVAVRPVDGYDTEGFYASMVSIDNTPPKAQLDLPLDGETVAGSLSVSGRVSDNIAIDSSRIEVAPIGSSAPPALVINLGTDKIVQRAIDVSSLKEGSYTIKLIVRDRADNESMASRDVTLASTAPLDTVSIVFPVEGDQEIGKLRVQGRAVIASGAGTVTVLADGKPLGTAEPDPLGWYFLDVAPDMLGDGDHVLKAQTSAKDGKLVESPEARLGWKTLGPWISIDSIPTGKFVSYRPYLRGSAGWAAEPPPEGDKKALAEYQSLQKTRQVKSVEISLDDGRSFVPASGTAKWSFRLETQDYKEGSLHVIVRAKYLDGSESTIKGLYFLDKTPPEVEVLYPEEGGRFNGVVELSGRSFDQNGMDTVGVALRKGDKANYQLPSFIQGLYIDGQMLGATDWQAGLGLTFFGDNVKLQGIFGQQTDSTQSFFGDVVGAKLVANLLYLPFDSFLGPDWSFLSSSLGIGANFTYFTKTQVENQGLMLGSVFAQLEFPKVTFNNWSAFKKFSFYAEYQLWVLSSVVSGGFIQKASFGARIGVF